MSSHKFYSQKSVILAMLCIFVITFIIGFITGWMHRNIYDINEEKNNIMKNMEYNKCRSRNISICKKRSCLQNKENNKIKVEGTMHSQDPRAGDNSVARMHDESNEDPDHMMVARMTPPDLEISEDRNNAGRDTPYDRRHIDSMADNPDEQLLKSYESPFSSWRIENNAYTGV